MNEITQTRRILNWVGLTAAGILALGSLLLIATTHNPPVSGTGPPMSDSNDIYSKHLSNAATYGYPPDDRSQFIAQCETGHRTIGDVTN